jgi:hypothetical protein
MALNIDRTRLTQGWFGVGPPDEQRDAEHRAHEERKLARVGLIGRRGLGHGGPVSTGMAGSWLHSNQPGS